MPYSERLNLFITFSYEKKREDYLLVLLIRYCALAHSADLIPLAFDPNAVILKYCGIEPIYIVDYFDYWEIFEITTNINCQRKL